MKKVKQLLRPIKTLSFVFTGFLYDFYRFYRYAAWRGLNDKCKKDYAAVKIYHRLEKSLSLRGRRSQSGVEAVIALDKHLRVTRESGAEFGFQEKVGVGVLRGFLNQFPAGNIEISQVKESIKEYQNEGGVEEGFLHYSNEELSEGILENPEKFFMSRFSVRSFQSRKVEPELIERALTLACKTPSVCNRQAWHVYGISNRHDIDMALSFQNGNRGFGGSVENLLIITADLSAFDTASERYQHWIDGGMYSMSIIMALHSLGLAACCLNWSKGPVDDMKIRSKVKIQDCHSILMMVAVGYADEKLNVCRSTRRPLNELYTILDK
jgi:nitroreductase